ncbi:MAG: 5-deoxy-glucuronate isomerase [Devosia sp.]
MPDLRVRPNLDDRRRHHITPQSAGWTYVGFDLWQLSEGDTGSGQNTTREVCLVFVAGKGRVTIDGTTDYGELGGRASPFDGPPHSVYVPAGHDWSVMATTPLTLAVCSAPGAGGYEPRAIPPGTHPPITRGKGSNTRYVTNILPEDDAAHSLLVVEVITPGGNTSSYPPHKHDTDNLPAESLLEETYYHRLKPAQGFAMQRVYTDDRSLDEAVVIEDGDVTLVPRGYHPVAAVHGYDVYYLNVMAGPKRTWKFYNAPEHEWLLK